ncbi:MAG: FUSC family protein [Acidobacteriaceae bacterium]|nr:FUSC family protein [Acidobacteriaceae bacterium]
MNGTTLQALWRIITRVDKSKINAWMALRNTLAVALPLGIAMALRHPLAGVAISTGALNVSYSDGRDPYAQRARRMLAWTLLGGIAVFIGSVTGRTSWLAVLAAVVWAFGAGMLVSVSTRAGDLGLNTLVICIVFGARGAMDAKGALAASLLAISGGLMQMLSALVFWPLRPDAPERVAIGKVYAGLSNELDPSSADPLSTPLSSPSPQMQETLNALGRDHSIESERYRMLYDQADRIRLSAYVLNRLRSELYHEQRRQRDPTDAYIAAIDRLLLQAGRVTAAVSAALLSNQARIEDAVLAQKLETFLKEVNAATRDSAAPFATEMFAAMDVLAGQLRSVLRLAEHSSMCDVFEHQAASHPWRLEVRSWIGTLRANLDPRTPVCRHAIRLAVCVALGDGIGRMISWQRSYWIPMTIAVVLKPDFATTFSRGILRLAGTFAGLLLATVLYHLFPVSAVALTQAVLVGAFTFMLRSVGPANYGVFTVAVSGLIVFLIAATGISPKEVVAERAMNTAAGGIFALIAYALWPTWERTHVSDVMADVIDRCRDYFRAVADRFGIDAITREDELDGVRGAWRRARSNAEASVDRLSSEPGTSPEQLALLTSMLASSHALVHAIMALEAALIHGQAQRVPEAFRTFAKDVDFTLYFLAQALRGSHAAFEILPKLRQDHRRLVEARDQFSPNPELVLVETDRVTTGLNTLREQVMRYVAQPVAMPAHEAAAAR